MAISLKPLTRQLLNMILINDNPFVVCNNYPIDDIYGATLAAMETLEFILACNGYCSQRAHFPTGLVGGDVSDELLMELEVAVDQALSPFCQVGEV
jgi:hypothetical protein